MAREKSNKKRGVQFTHESAKHIADIVRRIDGGGRGMDTMGLGRNAQAASHYLSKTTSEWNKGSSQTLTIHAGAAGSETAISGQTISAYNKLAKVSSGAWVIVGRANGAFYLVAYAEEEEEEETSCKSKIGSLNLSDITGYDASKTQVLAHTSGCLKWINTTTCT